MTHHFVNAKLAPRCKGSKSGAHHPYRFGRGVGERCLACGETLELVLAAPSDVIYLGAES